MRKDQIIQGQWNLYINQWFLGHGIWTTSSSISTWELVGNASDQSQLRTFASEILSGAQWFVSLPDVSDIHWSVRTVNIKFTSGPHIFWAFDENYILSWRQGWGNSGKFFFFYIQYSKINEKKKFGQWHSVKQKTRPNSIRVITIPLY